MTRKQADRDLVVKAQAATAAQSAAKPMPATAPRPPKTRKTDLVRSLLQKEGGATLAVLCAATGWQAHSARAVLSTLRKAGHGIRREAGPDGAAVYRLVPAPADAAVEPGCTGQAAQTEADA